MVSRLGRNNSSSISIINALTYTIAVLVVFCLCAIDLVVSIVIVITGGITVKHRIIFKFAQAIKLARKVFYVVLDKTRTLTNSKFLIVVKEYFFLEF